MLITYNLIGVNESLPYLHKKHQSFCRHDMTDNSAYVQNCTVFTKIVSKCAAFQSTMFLLTYIIYSTYSILVMVIVK